jgi:hypothetical protein
MPDDVHLDEDIDLMSEDSEDTSLGNSQYMFKDCGRRINECLMDGAEIPDELYVDLILAKLRMTFEHKTKA